MLGTANVNAFRMLLTGHIIVAHTQQMAIQNIASVPVRMYEEYLMSSPKLSESIGFSSVSSTAKYVLTQKKLNMRKKIVCGDGLRCYCGE